MASKILVIGGSVRPKRLSPSISSWIAKLGKEYTGDNYEVIDLKDYPLPMDAEPGIPAFSEYEFEETKAWSRKISSGDGYVFVTPEYNGGYPAALKNALDHLGREWKDKPAVIVSYGGGASGARAATQLNEVVRGLGLKVQELRPKFAVPRSVLATNAGQIDAEAELSSQVGDLKTALVELSEDLKKSKQ